jgi:hypothetical protein
LNTSSTSEKTLAEKVDERQQFLEKILPFVVILVRDEGKSLKHEVHNAHTSGESELVDFLGFSFKRGYGFSMYGGQGVTIWYHPGSERNTQNTVLSVDWWEDKKFQVNHFDASPEWQLCLLNLVGDKPGAVALFKQKLQERKEREEEIALQNRLKEKAEKDLQEAAKRLGLVA